MSKATALVPPKSHLADMAMSSRQTDRPKVVPMHSQFDCRAADPPPGLPVITGARWFDHQDTPFILHIELPLTSEEMVAALYGAVQADEIGSDEDSCG